MQSFEAAYGPSKVLQVNANAKRDFQTVEICVEIERSEFVISAVGAHHLCSQPTVKSSFAA